MVTPHSRLRLSRLEDRLNPAPLSATLNGSNLTVSGTPTGILLIDGEAGGIRVRDNNGAINLGTFPVAGNLTVNLSFRRDAVDIDLDGQTLMGNLTVDLGAGDVFGPTQPLNIYDGTVNGNIFLRNGNGRETFSLGLPQLVPAPLTVNGNVYVTGRAGAVGDAFLLGAGSGVASDLILTQVDDIDIGGPIGLTPAAVVNRHLIANASNAPTFMTLNVAGLVAGNVTAIGSNFFDAATNVLGDSVSVLDTGIVAGSLTAVMNGGHNYLSIIGGQVNGNLTYNGGNAPDQVRFGDSMFGVGGTVGGHANVTLGNGSNRFELAPAAAVLGALNANAGSGTDDFSVFAGFIGGGVSASLGNGENTLDLTATVGGRRFRYAGGSGVDSLTIRSSNAFALVATLGAGADLFTYDIGARVGSADIDFGVDFDADSYIDNGATVDWAQTLRNIL